MELADITIQVAAHHFLGLGLSLLGETIALFCFYVSILEHACPLSPHQMEGTQYLLRLIGGSG